MTDDKLRYTKWDLPHEGRTAALREKFREMIESDDPAEAATGRLMDCAVPQTLDWLEKEINGGTRFSTIVAALGSVSDTILQTGLINLAKAAGCEPNEIAKLMLACRDKAYEVRTSLAESFEAEAESANGGERKYDA